VDVDAVAITDNEVTVSLNEYGNAAITSARIRGFSYLIVSSDVANVIGYNAGISFDCLARNPLLAGTNVRYSGAATSRVTVANTHALSADNVRRAATDLTNRNVQRFPNGLYRAFIAPDVAYDLRKETGAAAWRDPHTYSQPEQIWNGETGSFEGFAFTETPRLAAPALATTGGGPGGFVDGGVGGTVDVYPSLFLGKQALAKAWSSAVSGPTPQVILGLVVDKLQRFVPVGWYWLGGFGRFREEAIVRYESASTIGAN
jgi:N4-gp56 family major capsid protein